MAAFRIDGQSLRRHSLATIWKLTITNPRVLMARPKLSPATITITMIITTVMDIITDITMEPRRRMRDGSVGPSSLFSASCWSR